MISGWWCLLKIIFSGELGRLPIYPKGGNEKCDKCQATIPDKGHVFWQLVENSWSMWGGIYIQYEDQ